MSEPGSFNATPLPIFNMPPCHVFAFICANTHTKALKKNLIFPNYQFGKGQYAFYPVELYSFAGEK